MEYLGDDSATSVVTIKGNKGRCTIASRDIAAGEPLYIARPDMCVLYSSFGSSYCQYCYQPTEMPRASEPASAIASDLQSYTCPHCDQFVLCQRCVGLLKMEVERNINEPPSKGASGEEPCALLSHPLLRVHQTSCGWYNELPPAVRASGMDTDYIRFCLLYGAKVLHEDLACLAHMEALVDNVDTQPAEVIAFCRTFARDKVVATFGPSSSLASATASTPRFPVSAEDLTSMLLKVRCNSIGFPFSKDDTLGWTLQGKLCMVNHSCLPNAAIVLAEENRHCQALLTRHPKSVHQVDAADLPIGSKLVGCCCLVALRNIKKGDEVTISYVDMETNQDDVVERSRVLLETFRFLCTCELCIRQRAERKAQEKGGRLG